MEARAAAICIQRGFRKYFHKQKCDSCQRYKNEELVIYCSGCQENICEDCDNGDCPDWTDEWYCSECWATI